MPQKPGAKNTRWRGGITVDPRGYIKIQVGREHPLSDPKGYSYLHHLVVASAGIPVAPDEDIHHENEDKGDCRLVNLEVKGHVEHARDHAAKQPRAHGKFARREEAQP